MGLKNIAQGLHRKRVMAEAKERVTAEVEAEADAQASVMETKLEVISEMLEKGRALVAELESAETAEVASDIDAAVDEVFDLIRALGEMGHECKRAKGGPSDGL